ncbi:MAG: hypothetical protein ACE5NG_06175 [bacterium]
MNRLSSAKVILTIIVLATAQSMAQPDISTISFKTGLIRNLYTEHYGRFTSTYSIYPELQIGGALVPSNLLRWALYLGYWDDGVDKAFPIADFRTYSYNSLILGSRLGFMPGANRKDWPVQLEFFAGFSHHFVGKNYVGGTAFKGDIGHDSHMELNYAEIGISAGVDLKRLWQVVVEVQQAMQLGNDEFNFPEKRLAFKVGLAYSF